MQEDVKVTDEVAVENEGVEAAVEEVKEAAGEERAAAETAADDGGAESMEDYANELEASFKKLSEGDTITGTVIGVSDTEVSLDLKYYAEGLIAKENLSNDPEFNIKEEIKVGDEITATIIKVDDGQGNILLSRKEANDRMTWEKFRGMLADRTPINVKIDGVVNSGVVAYVDGVRGFIPASKLAAGYVEDLNEWLGKNIDVTIITAEEEGKRLVLSGKEIAQQKAAAEKNARIAKCEVGAVMEGTVDSLKEYGAFVSLENGLSGLVHISQISNQRIKNPAAVLKEGQTVKVKIIGIKDNKISLSMKALIEDPEADIDTGGFEYHEDQSASTSLGSLLAGFKLDK